MSKEYAQGKKFNDNLALSQHANQLKAPPSEEERTPLANNQKGTKPLSHRLY